jgi:Uma2 family endonuclease
VVIARRDVMAQREIPMMDVEDYLVLDESSKNVRYEFLDGELRMLAGGSADHSVITTNLTSMLYAILRDGPCRVYNSDMRLQLSGSRYVYPDITITCDQRDKRPEDNMTHYPKVVVEALSPGTEAVDRGKKFFYYRALASIEEYVMVDYQSVQIEVYRRNEETWTLSTYGAGNVVRLESLDIAFEVDEVYRETALAEEERS